MSKTEERAKELFPLLETDKIGNNPYISYNIEQLSKQEGFIEGYHQAEKDLELTWEDMRELYIIFAEVDVGIELCKTDIQAETIGYYQEVLKRFKERKGEKV